RRLFAHDCPALVCVATSVAQRSPLLTFRDPRKRWNGGVSVGISVPTQGLIILGSRVRAPPSLPLKPQERTQTPRTAARAGCSRNCSHREPRSSRRPLFPWLLDAPPRACNNLTTRRREQPR